MERIKRTFHLLSYLYYPMIAAALFFVFKPYVFGIDHLLENIDSLPGDLNNGLIFMGLAMSLMTLQDPSKPAVIFGKKTLQDAKKAKRIIINLIIVTFFALGYGLIGYFFSDNKVLSQMSFGMIIMGIGLVGVLKTVMEIHENYCKKARR